MTRTRGWMLAAVLTVSSASAAPAEVVVPAPLAERVGAFEAVLAGKDIRHRYVRDAIEPLFLDIDGRDRFLLGWVAAVRQAGITDGRVRRLAITPVEVDDALGFSVFRARVCGRWHGWIPRCMTRDLRWREIAGRWHLVPPDSIQLDPRDL